MGRDYEKFFALTLEMIAVCDLDGVTKEVNDAWCSVTGWSRDELVGKPFYGFYHPDELPQIEKNMAGCREGIPVRNVVIRYRHKKGHWLWLACSGTPSLETGEVLGFAQDITKQRELEDALRGRETFLTTLIDSLPVALFCEDGHDDFKIVHWNKKARDLLGIAEEEALGKRGQDVFTHGPSSFRQSDEALLKAGTPVEFSEELFHSKSRGEVYLQPKKVPVHDSNGIPRYILGIATDVTDRKRLEDERAKSFQRARMASLGEMASGIGHEINNPLSIVQTSACHLKTLIEKREQDPQKLLELCEKIETTSLKIGKIVRGLRALARESSQDPLSPIAVASVVDDAMELCRARFAFEKIKLSVSEIATHWMVEARGPQLSQVILNLLSNSFDAVQGLEDSWVRVGVEAFGEQIIIAVEDSGPGVPLSLRPELMKPFFTTKEAGKGTGLGLAISKGIIESHRGKLYAEFDKPFTRFVIELPLCLHRR